MIHEHCCAWNFIKMHEKNFANVFYPSSNEFLTVNIFDVFLEEQKCEAERCLHAELRKIITFEIFNWLVDLKKEEEEDLTIIRCFFDFEEF